MGLLAFSSPSPYRQLRRSGAISARFVKYNIAKQKGPRQCRGPFWLLIVVMNDSLAAITVRVFFLDHGRRVARFMLLEHRGAITIAVAVMIMGFADGYAGADRPDADADILRRAKPRSNAPTSM